MKSNPTNNDNFKEQVTHGELDFPLQLYNEVEYYESGLVFYNHWHEEAEILYVLDGEMELVVDGISIFAKKNTVVLIPPNLLHVAYQHKNQKCCFSSIVFHSDFISSKNEDRIQHLQLNPFLENTFVSSYVLDTNDRKNELVRQLLSELFRSYAGNHIYRELHIKGCLLQLLYHLLQKEEKHNMRSTTDYVTEERKKKVLAYIDENYQNNVTLDSLAKCISLSKEQFCRFFKASFRATPIQYINRYRINRAMDLLRETSLSVIDIALEVGFESSNYFSISFKKATDMTPSEFRHLRDK